MLSCTLICLIEDLGLVKDLNTPYILKYIAKLLKSEKGYFISKNMKFFINGEKTSSVYVKKHRAAGCV